MYTVEGLTGNFIPFFEAYKSYENKNLLLEAFKVISKERYYLYYLNSDYYIVPNELGYSVKEILSYLYTVKYNSLIAKSHKKSFVPSMNYKQAITLARKVEINYALPDNYHLPNHLESYLERYISGNSIWVTNCPSFFHRYLDNPENLSSYECTSTFNNFHNVDHYGTSFTGSIHLIDNEHIGETSNRITDDLIACIPYENILNKSEKTSLSSFNIIEGEYKGKWYPIRVFNDKSIKKIMLNNKENLDNWNKICDFCNFSMGFCWTQSLSLTVEEFYEISTGSGNAGETPIGSILLFDVMINSKYNDEMLSRRITAFMNQVFFLYVGHQDIRDNLQLKRLNPFSIKIIDIYNDENFRNLISEFEISYFGRTLDLDVRHELQRVNNDLIIC